MSIRGDLDRLLSGELDACLRALKGNDNEKALRELRNAIQKLESLKAPIGRLEQAARKDNKF